MKLTAATTLATGIAGSRAWSDVTKYGRMIYRTLVCSAGVQVSACGLGGCHIGIPLVERESVKIIRTAIDRGITFMDNCWDYNEGKSEIRMGKALAATATAKRFF